MKVQRYEPYKYPPNYTLAEVHKKATMPGLPTKEQCPCCERNLRQPFESWVTRSIDKDFKNYGGAVVTYFWLLYFYTGVVGFIVALFSIYLWVVISTYCDAVVCENFYGIWILSNELLYRRLVDLKHLEVTVRLFTLRGMVFVTLLLTNFASIYLVRRFQKRYPPKPHIGEFALLFKRVHISLDELKALVATATNCEIKEIFGLQRMEPYYSLNKSRLCTYYEYLIAPEQKKTGLMKKLIKFNKKASAEEGSFGMQGDRYIVVLTTREGRDAVLEKFGISSRLERWKIKAGLGSKFQQDMHCEPCPRPQEILWNNIGHVGQSKFKQELLSLVYFFCLLAASYLMLEICMRIVYGRVLKEPLNSIAVNLILLFVVAIALTFRQFMNKLADMRNPTTYTTRTTFIVATTVLFHFIYYLIIPTLYFSAAIERKNQILKVITNQTMTFVLVQLILAGIDLMHCCWNRNKEKAWDTSNPIGCQMLLHEATQYPRFPIEFKLIILFKLWSFVIFFAFQVPVVLIGLFVGLLFLCVKDKHNVYTHYRMEFISNQVQANFLRIYGNFFTIYMFLIFILTQHLEVELWLSFALTLVTVIGQTIFSFQKVEQERDDDVIPPTVDDVYGPTSYLKHFEEFFRVSNHAETNEAISELIASNAPKAVSEIQQSLV